MPHLYFDDCGGRDDPRRIKGLQLGQGPGAQPADGDDADADRGVLGLLPSRRAVGQRFAPHLFEIVVRPDLGPEQMHDHVANPRRPPAELMVRGLTAGGNRIRTIGPASGKGQDRAQPVSPVWPERKLSRPDIGDRRSFCARRPIGGAAVTGPILIVGGRHRKGSAIPAVPHLAQLQSPTYQWVLTGLPGSTWRSARGTDLYRSSVLLSRGP